MKNTWRQTFRRLAAGCVVAGSVAWSSAMCYAVTLASDTPDDVAYADGWQEGDDGGTGFGPWSFDGTSFNLVYNVTPSHKIDNGLKTGVSGSSPFNDIGRAWTIYNYNGPPPIPNNPPNPPQGATDIARAGRGFSALQPGQTLTVIVDHPTERRFFRGYFVRFNGGTGGANGNICYAGLPCTPGGTPEPKLGVNMFDYFSYGEWYVPDGIDADPATPNKHDAWPTGLIDTDTSAGGLQIEVEMTGAETYDLTLTPLGDPGAAYMQSGSFSSPGMPLDWIEFTFFNTDSDFYPTMVADARATDIYIRSIAITTPDPPGVPGDFNGDNKVDAADYVVWRKNNGTNNGLPNDNGLGTPITGAHYNLWRANFGDMAGSGSAPAVGAVPEPGTFVYLMFAAAGVMVLGLRAPKRAMLAEVCVAQQPRK